MVGTVAVTLVCSEAIAKTTLGGRIQKAGKHSTHIQFGYPELAVTYTVPITRKFDVAAEFSFYYARGFMGGGLDPGQIGDTFGARLRYAISSTRRFSMAYVARPAVIMNYSPEFDVGLRIGLPGGLSLGYDVGSGVILMGGFHLPMAIVFHPNVLFTLPVDFEFGVALPIGKTLNLTLALRVGPVVIVPKGGDSHVGLNLSGLFGFEFD